MLVKERAELELPREPRAASPRRPCLPWLRGQPRDPQHHADKNRRCRVHDRTPDAPRVPEVQNWEACPSSLVPRDDARGRSLIHYRRRTTQGAYLVEDAVSQIA